MSLQPFGGETEPPIEPSVGVSGVTLRLQEVGRTIIEQGLLQQIGETTFSNIGSGEYTSRIRTAATAGTPLLEVHTVNRGGKISDRPVNSALFDILGANQDSPIILKALRFDPTKHTSRLNPEETELHGKALGLVIPGSHTISLTGSYGSTVESVLESIHFNLATGRFSTGFGYEETQRERQSMHAFMDTLLTECGISTAISRLSARPSGLVAVESNHNNTVGGLKDGASAKDFADLVHELLGDQTVKELHIPFEDPSMPLRITLGELTEINGYVLRLVELFGGALEHFHGIKPTSWSFADTPGLQPEDPYGTSLVLRFDETPANNIMHDTSHPEEKQSTETPHDPDALTLDKARGTEFIDDPLYTRDGQGDTVAIDPTTLNLDALPMILAMAGWIVQVGYPDDTGETVRLDLYDVGGADGKNGTEMALALGMIDKESGKLWPGFTVDDESGKTVISYSGSTNLVFASFAQNLFALSPFQAR